MQQSTAHSQKAECLEAQTGAPLHLLCITPMCISPQVEFTPVLTARHDPLWESSGETVFQFGLVCVLHEGVFMLHISCQSPGGSGFTVLICV